MTRTATRSRSRRKACSRCASSTRWITSRARCSSNTSRSSSSSAFARSSQSSCASPPDAYLRLIFAGTPAFAAQALARLLEAGHSISLVLTQPDRPAGRGQHSVAPAVKNLAVEHGLEVLQPASLRDEALIERLRAVGAAAMRGELCAEDRQGGNLAALATAGKRT